MAEKFWSSAELSLGPWKARSCQSKVSTNYSLQIPYTPLGTLTPLTYLPNPPFLRVWFWNWWEGHSPRLYSHSYNHGSKLWLVLFSWLTNDRADFQALKFNCTYVATPSKICIVLHFDPIADFVILEPLWPLNTLFEQLWAALTVDYWPTTVAAVPIESVTASMGGVDQGVDGGPLVLYTDLHQYGIFFSWYSDNW